MNFNEHATHHAYPNIPWYQLPNQPNQVPEKFRSNQNVRTVRQAVLQQLKGPKIVYDASAAARPKGR